MLSEKSPEYAKAKRENKPIIVVLHSCRTGRETVDKENGNKPTPSLAKKITQKYSNVIIIAPDERVGFANGEDGGYEMGPMKADPNSLNEEGEWKDSNKPKYSGERGKWYTIKKDNIIDENKNLSDAKEKAKEDLEQKEEIKD